MNATKNKATQDKAKSITHQPHDSFTKAALAYKQVALEIFQELLPTAICRRINFASLRLCQSQLVEDNLKKSATDLIYQSELQQAESQTESALYQGKQINGKPCYCYLHCEQNTRGERQLPLCNLRYVCNILIQHMRQYPNEALPPVFTVVIYNGKSAYSHETDLLKMFADPELAKECLFGPMNLLDLSTTPDTKLMKRPWAGALLGTLKHAPRPSCGSFIRDQLAVFFNEFAKLGAMEYITIIVNYIYTQGEFIDEKTIRTLIEGRVSKEVEHTMTSLAERLVQQGHQQCYQQMSGQLDQVSGQLDQVSGQLSNVAVELIKDGNMPLKKIAQLFGLSINQLKHLVEKQEQTVE